MQNTATIDTKSMVSKGYFMCPLSSPVMEAKMFIQHIGLHQDTRSWQQHRLRTTINCHSMSVYTCVNCTLPKTLTFSPKILARLRSTLPVSNATPASSALEPPALRSSDAGARRCDSAGCWGSEQACEGGQQGEGTHPPHTFPPVAQLLRTVYVVLHQRHHLSHPRHTCSAGRSPKKCSPSLHTHTHPHLLPGCCAQCPRPAAPPQLLHATHAPPAGHTLAVAPLALCG